MPRLLKSIGLSFCFFFSFLVIAFAEDITITTYYPSPYGSYRELRARRIAIGDNYIDAAAFTWETVNGDGGEVDFQADLVVEGNAGIGTANPAGRLIVRGAGAAAGIGLQTQNSGGTALVTMLDSGNVGIGTAVPVSRLNVVGAANDSALHISQGDLTISGGNTVPWWRGSRIRFFSRDDTNHAIYYSGQTNSLHFDSYTQMYFNQGFYTPGNVGIGTAAPLSKLEVSGANGQSALHVNLGDISVRGGNMGNSGIRLFDRNDTNHRIYYSGATNSVHFDSYAWMYFNQGFYTPGPIGIGTMAPGAYQLNVQGDAYINGRLRSLDLNTRVINGGCYATGAREICVKAFDPGAPAGTEKCSYGGSCCTGGPIRYVCLQTGP